MAPSTAPTVESDRSAGPPSFVFEERPVHPALADLATTVWTANGRISYGRERILPTANPVLVVNLGTGFRVRSSKSPETDDLMREGWLVGPQTGYVENEPLAETDVVGVILKPWGPGALFDLSAAEITDRTIDLELIWGPGLDQLRECLAREERSGARGEVLVRSLLARRHRGPPGSVLVAADGLASGNLESVALAASELRISRKHLNHLFDRYVGLGPRSYARVHRFNRALRTLGTAWAPPLAVVAHDLGYYDQSHLNRDFADFAGITPTEYRRLRVAHLTPDVDDAGLFVPGI